MKRMTLAAVTALVLALSGLLSGTAQADHPHGYRAGYGGYGPGGVAVGYRYGGYGYGSNVNIALRAPNIAYSAGYGYAPHCHCYPPPPCGVGYGGYAPYAQRPRVSFSFGY